MSKRTRYVICLVSFCVAALLPAFPIYAEDENLDSTVYMVFDPETGELITVQEPSITSRYHSSKAADSTQAATDSTADPAEYQLVSLLLGGVLALGLLGGAVAWIRKSKEQSS